MRHSLFITMILDLGLIKPKHRKPVEYTINNGCWECVSHKRNTSDYPVIKIKGIDYIMSRVIYKHFKGDFDNSLMIRHTCDNTICINPDHLLTGTHQDNVNDKMERDRQPRGNIHGRSKLNDDKAREILLSEESIGTLAKKYNVSERCIRQIKYRDSWKHVKV